MQPIDFQQRRRRLMDRMGPGSIAILATARVHRRNGDVEYPFRPDSDFYYLTGFAEPEAVAVLKPGAKAEFILFCRERDAEKERWNGPRAGLKGAKRRFGADQALAIDGLEQHLPEMLSGCRQVYYVLGDHPELDRKLPRWMRQLRAKGRSGIEGPREIVALDQLLHEMRLIKGPEELERMRQAAAISAQGHQRMMQVCGSLDWEYQLEAEFLHECQRQGARHQAYPAIIAGGANACTLHYTENDQALRAGELVLIDAGCEYQHYAADITRTFPLNGRFSEPQRLLYELVLAAQRSALDQVRPGKRWIAPHNAAVKTLTKGLIELGLLKEPVLRAIKKRDYQRFFMHRTGHWLGLDVHDVGAYKRDGHWRPFEPGMVLTIEPGLYVAKDDKTVDKKWRGICIRVEDNVLVTETGHEVLTQGAPKTVAEIESLMAQ